jgi:hypothetical protein
MEFVIDLFLLKLHAPLHERFLADPFTFMFSAVDRCFQPVSRMVEERADTQVKKHLAEIFFAQVSLQLIQEVLAEYVEVFLFIGVVTGCNDLEF